MAEYVDEWINSGQFGGNFGIEMVANRFTLRLGYNPETAGKETQGQIDIGNDPWPSGVKVNFNALQVLIGYQIPYGRIQATIYSGVSFCWLSVPNDYQSRFEEIGTREFSTKKSIGPTLQTSLRYRMIGEGANGIFLSFDLGYVYPRFNKYLDDELTGNHYYFKLGVAFFYVPRFY